MHLFCKVLCLIRIRNEEDVGESNYMHTHFGSILLAVSCPRTECQMEVEAVESMGAIQVTMALQKAGFRMMPYPCPLLC
jgi:hypothetical protein